MQTLHAQFIMTNHVMCGAVYWFILIASAHYNRLVVSRGWQWLTVVLMDLSLSGARRACRLTLSGLVGLASKCIVYLHCEWEYHQRTPGLMWPNITFQRLQISLWLEAEQFARRHQYIQCNPAIWCQTAVCWYFMHAECLSGSNKVSSEESQCFWRRDSTGIWYTFVFCLHRQSMVLPDFPQGVFARLPVQCIIWYQRDESI